MAAINPVGTWLDPNFETAGDGTTYKTQIDNSIRVGKRIANAFAAHENNPVGMSVVIEPGMLWVSSALLEVGQQVISSIPAPTTNHRIDRIVIDKTTGVASRVQGAEGAPPVIAAIPSNKLPCVHFELAPAHTAIRNSDLNDERLGGGSGNEIKMFDAPSNLVSRTTGVGFTDVDISGPTGGDIAKSAILQVRLKITVTGEAGVPDINGEGDALARFRRNGSFTVNNLPRVELYMKTGLPGAVGHAITQTIIVETDTSEIFEYDLATNLYSASGSVVINEFRVDLIGYVV